MSFLSNIFGRQPDRERLRPLYDAAVAAGRDRAWYLEGQVPDTIDGRFDMIAAVVTLVLLRLEEEGERTRPETVLLAELFIEDMEGNIRQLGTGDLMVGKHIGKMMGALGGRLTVFRKAVAGEGGLDAVVARNVFHDKPPSEEGVRFVADRLERFHDSLKAVSSDEVIAGRLPKP